MLLQNRAGYWDPSPDLAVALMAQKIRPENIVRVKKEKGLFTKAKSVAALWAPAAPKSPAEGGEEAGGDEEKRTAGGAGGGRKPQHHHHHHDKKDKKKKVCVVAAA